MAIILLFKRERDRKQGKVLKAEQFSIYIMPFFFLFF